MRQDDLPDRAGWREAVGVAAGWLLPWQQSANPGITAWAKGQTGIIGGHAGIAGTLTKAEQAPIRETQREQLAGLDEDDLLALHPRVRRARASAQALKAERLAEARKAGGHTHHQALRALANRLVGILHGCLRHRQPYNEQSAWATITQSDLAQAA